MKDAMKWVTLYCNYSFLRLIKSIDSLKKNEMDKYTVGFQYIELF